MLVWFKMINYDYCKKEVKQDYVQIEINNWIVDLCNEIEARKYIQDKIKIHKMKKIKDDWTKKTDEMQGKKLRKDFKKE